MRDRRIGRFLVSERFFVGAENGEGANLFHGMIVMSAERKWDRAVTEYFAWHPQFEHAKEGQIIPEYEATFGPQDIYPTWRRLDMNNDGSVK